VNEFGANSKTIFIEKSDSLLGTYTNIKSDSLNKENRGVEGPAIFKLNKDDADVDTWCLLVDNYGAGGYYPLLTTDLDSGVFTRPEAGTYKMPTDARHGTPIRITREEYCRVMGIEYTPTETSTPTPAAPSGVDLSGTKVLYEEGTVTYDEATGSVTGTNVKGLLIPLGITIPIGAPVDITVSGTASTGMRSWLSDGSEQRMSDIVNPISFDQKFTLVAEPFENGNVADHLQIKGPSYDSSFSKITITKVVVEYDPSKAPTPSPVPTEKPTKAPTKEPTPTDPATPTQVPGATQAPGTPTQAPGTPTQAPGTATQAPGTATQAPGTATQAPSDTTAKKASVSISGKKKVKAGKKITLTAKIKNIDAKCTYKWSVNKKKIAAITQNKKKKNKASLKGKKAGTVKVTVKVMNGNKLLAKKTVKIKVLKK
jgi:hypothetical protein